MDDLTTAKFEVTELISRYGNHLDAGEFDEMESLFEPEAEFHVLPGDGVPALIGARSIRQAVEDRWSLVHQSAQRRHVMSNIVVDLVDDNRATARTVLVVYEVSKTPGSAVSVHGMGVYDDVVARFEAGWRFVERRLTLDRTDYFAPGWRSTD